MPVNAAVDNQFTFVAGLNTEASYFTFPANTWKEGDNVVPNINGVLSKRSALDLESGHVYAGSVTASDVAQYAFSSHKWNNVAGNGDLSFLVAQVGPLIYFYVDTPVSTSTTIKAFTINLASYKAVGNTNITGTAAIKATTANGKLLMVSRDTEPLLVAYNPDTDTISVETVLIQVRDFEGVDDGLEVATQPYTLTSLHKYNLYNQGWPQDKIDAYHTAKSIYPSNAQSWIYGKNADDNFDSAVLDKQDFGTSPAPKGRYVLEAFNKDRSSVSGVAGIPVVTETNRPTTCAFFAGRAWWAGVESSRIGTNVYFSQVALGEERYGKCYQDADPTSEIVSDLIDSDGGVIPIQDCGRVIDLVSMGNGVLVLASNGVWLIAGTSQSGFTATGYEVVKISGFGCVGRNTVVDVEDTVLFWSKNAICRIDANNAVTSLTDLNIKTLYNDIGQLAKQYTSGRYNGSEKVVYWMYNGELTTDDSQHAYKKTKALILDVRTTAFYTMSFPTTSSLPYVVDGVTTNELYQDVMEFQVVDSGGNLVVNSGGVQVGADISTKYATSKQFKWLTVALNSGVYKVTWADMLNARVAPSKWYDWYNYNSTGEGYDCYFVTGYSFAPNGPDKKKQATYITTYMKKTETGLDVDYNPVNESSCLLSSKWDFTDSGNANKWGSEQQIYRHVRMFIPNSTAMDDGYPVVITKNKLRGRGRAVQLKFAAETDYDMQLLGWSVVYMGGNNV